MHSGGACNCSWCITVRRCTRRSADCRTFPPHSPDDPDDRGRTPRLPTRTVSGTTKAAVVDKLRKLHADLDKGIVPETGYSNYTVRQAAGDWLAAGLPGRAAMLARYRMASPGGDCRW